MHYLIKDTEFEKILKLLNEIKGIHRRDRGKIRKFLEAICYISRSGCQWRLLPTYYGNWRSIHKRFKEWNKRSVWRRLFHSAQQEPDMEWIMIDSTIVRSHACAAGYGKNTQEQEALGRSKGGFSTKIHALVDALGNPLKFILAPGQSSDITQAEALSKNISDSFIIADKGYDSNDFIQFMRRNHCTPVVPSKKNRKQPRDYDLYIYKERNLIECFFGKIKHFRRIFSRFDKSAQSYLAFLQFVGLLIWLR